MNHHDLLGRNRVYHRWLYKIKPELQCNALPNKIISGALGYLFHNAGSQGRSAKNSQNFMDKKYGFKPSEMK